MISLISRLMMGAGKLKEKYIFEWTYHASCSEILLCSVRKLE